MLGYIEERKWLRCPFSQAQEHLKINIFNENMKAAIKMDMQASKEFLSELKVLTHAHHLNSVRLIGYCVQGSLFLVYEYIENGNLSQHLHGSGRELLSWPARVQIALAAARRLAYIRDHIVANIGTH